MKTLCVVRRRRHSWILYAKNLSIALLLLLFSSISISSAHAAEKFFKMSLSELLDTEVTSVSKTSESRHDAAAAIYVITQADIQRSAANSIPDLLRTVPGINVARIDSNKWSITARGFGGAFANKLLVLIDGRSVYTPYFSGVYWDMRDAMLEDVDRIEIIRGPGGALWGANAVNGVINIVTKKVSDTQGGLLSVGAGNEEQAFGSLRYGWSNVDEDTFYRIYTKVVSRDTGGEIGSNGQGDDDWVSGRLGFRMDKTLANNDTLTIQGDYFDNQSDSTLGLSDFGTMIPFLMTDEIDSRGWNILGRWNRQLSDDSSIQLQGFWDYYEREDAIHGEKRHTWDLEFQHSFKPDERNQIVWGVGYRGTESDHHNTVYLGVEPTSLSQSIFNVFLQDQIEITDTLKLTLGTKVEHNGYTGIEIQPNIRVAWTPTEKYTFWASVSRAVRTPNESENYLSPLANITSSGIIAFVYGDRDAKSEELISVEGGFRATLSEKTALDVSVFHNNYDNLRSAVVDDTITPPVPTLVYRLVNTGKAKLYGLEAVLDWKTSSRLTAQFVYSYVEAHFNDAALGQDQYTPEQQFSLKSYISISENVELDATLRYVDRISGIGVDDYFTGDIRLAWTPKEDLSLELIGRDLFGPSHEEYVETIVPYISTEVERGIFAKVTWKF